MIKDHVIHMNFFSVTCVSVLNILAHIVPDCIQIHSNFYFQIKKYLTHIPVLLSKLCEYAIMYIENTFQIICETDGMIMTKRKNATYIRFCQYITTQMVSARLCCENWFDDAHYFMTIITRELDRICEWCGSFSFISFYNSSIGWHAYVMSLTQHRRNTCMPIDLLHKYHNAPVPYPTMHDSTL